MTIKIKVVGTQPRKAAQGPIKQTFRVEAPRKQGMAKQQAVMVVCPGVVNDGIAGHMMRDTCSSCAPFWEQYPTCPSCQRKLTTKLYCKECKKHYAPAARIDLKVSRVKVAGKKMLVERRGEVDPKLIERSRAEIRAKDVHSEAAKGLGVLRANAKALNAGRVASPIDGPPLTTGALLKIRNTSKIRMLADNLRGAAPALIDVQTMRMSEELMERRAKDSETMTRIVRLTVGGLCSMTLAGARAFLEDIRKLGKEHGGEE